VNAGDPEIGRCQNQRQFSSEKGREGKAHFKQKGSGKTEREHRHTGVRFSKGNVIYYKAHHLSKAHKDFHAGFAPEWWGPVTLTKQVGKGVFLTDQQQ